MCSGRNWRCSHTVRADFRNRRHRLEITRRVVFAHSMQFPGYGACHRNLVTGISPESRRRGVGCSNTQNRKQAFRPGEIARDSPVAPILPVRRETSLPVRNRRDSLAPPNTYRPAGRFSRELKRILPDGELLPPFPIFCRLVLLPLDFSLWTKELPMMLSLTKPEFAL
jgi:hypothetical protein